MKKDAAIVMSCHEHDAADQVRTTLERNRLRCYAIAPASYSRKFQKGVSSGSALVGYLAGSRPAAFGATGNPFDWFQIITHDNV